MGHRLQPEPLERGGRITQDFQTSSRPVLFVLGNGFAKLGALLSTSVIRGLLGALGWPPVLLCIAGAYAASGAMLLPMMADATHIDRAAAFVAGESTAASPGMDGDVWRRKDE